MQLSPTLMNGAKFDQDEYIAALQKLLVAIAFLENHRFYEGSGKALEQAKDLLIQARRKCQADFMNAVSMLSRGNRDETTRVIAWSKPNKQDAAKVAQLLNCLISAKLDQGELLQEYGRQRFQVMKMFLCDDPTSNSLGINPSESITELSLRLQNVEVSIKAEKALAESIFPTEELSHAAFRHAAHRVLEAVKADLDSSLHSSYAPGSGIKQQDLFKLLLLHELLVSRMGEYEALATPPLLLRDQRGKGIDDPWAISKLLNTIVSDVAGVTKQRLFGLQFELTEQISVASRSMSKDGNVHPVSSHVSGIGL